MHSRPAGAPDRDTQLRTWAARLIDLLQDLFVFVLAVVLIVLIARTLIDLFRIVTRSPLDVRASIAEVLYVFILVELIEILLVYLREHRVAVGFMVEVAIISALREVVGHGLVDFHWDQLLAISAFLLALGILVRIDKLHTGQRPAAVTTTGNDAEDGE